MPSPEEVFSDAELARYARSIMLREIGGRGQQRLRAARVLMVGAGGLGSPCLLCLAAAGVGRIALVDSDSVSLDNLQRQIIHDTHAVGARKTESAQARLHALNPHVIVETHARRLDAHTAAQLAGRCDLAIDGSDNYPTRLTLAKACMAERKPLIFGAAGQWDGQISLFRPWRGGPCYGCLFPVAPEGALAPDCAEGGVVSALPAVIGAMMALEAIKLITGAGDTLEGRLLMVDSLGARWHEVATRKNPHCPLCAKLE